MIGVMLLVVCLSILDDTSSGPIEPLKYLKEVKRSNISGSVHSCGLYRHNGNMIEEKQIDLLQLLQNVLLSSIAYSFMCCRCIYNNITQFAHW